MLQVSQSSNIVQNPTNFQSRILIPNGQPFVPDFVVKPAVPQIAPLQSIQYAQAAPYINTGAQVFKPFSQTQLGKEITPMPQNQPKMEDAVVVYQGPLKSVRPQMTPVEQFDNDIEKDTVKYFELKKSVNTEMDKIMRDVRKEKGRSLITDFAVFLGLVLAGIGIYKYRTKIPLIKNIFTK